MPKQSSLLSQNFHSLLSHRLKPSSPLLSSPDRTSSYLPRIELREKYSMPLLLAVQSAALGFDMIEMTWLSAFFIGAGCFALGCLIGARRSSRAASRLSKDAEIKDEGRKKVNRGKQLLEVEKLAEIIDDFKMVLVVRNDLKMGKGKIAAQCSHATLGLYKKILNRAPRSLSRWEMCGQVKVVVKIESEDEMLVLQERAKSLNLPTHITIDAGRTQIAPNSRTVMAVLGPADLVDDVTGGLKLL